MGIKEIKIISFDGIPPANPAMLLLFGLGVIGIISALIAIAPYIAAVGAIYWVLQRKAVQLKIEQKLMQYHLFILNKVRKEFEETKPKVTTLSEPDQEIALKAASDKVTAAIEVVNKTKNQSISLATEIQNNLLEARVNILKKASTTQSKKLVSTLKKTDEAIEGIAKLLDALNKFIP